MDSTRQAPARGGRRCFLRGAAARRRGGAGRQAQAAGGMCVRGGGVPLVVVMAAGWIEAIAALRVRSLYTRAQNR